MFILSAPELKEKDDDYFAIESERASLFTLPFAKSAITNFHNAVSVIIIVFFGGGIWIKVL